MKYRFRVGKAGPTNTSVFVTAEGEGISGYAGNMHVSDQLWSFLKDCIIAADHGAYSQIVEGDEDSA